MAEGGEPAPEERCVSQRILPGGMVKIELGLSPDEADLILRAIHRAQEDASVATPEAHAEPMTPPEDVSVERAEIASRSSSIWIRMFSDRTARIFAAETLRRVACDCGLAVDALLAVG